MDRPQALQFGTTILILIFTVMLLASGVSREWFWPYLVLSFKLIFFFVPVLIVFGLGTGITFLSRDYFDADNTATGIALIVTAFVVGALFALVAPYAIMASDWVFSLTGPEVPWGIWFAIGAIWSAWMFLVED